ncbi:MAG: histidine phosphatase family protein [Candidatus Heimdallarchaeota archaeon]
MDVDLIWNQQKWTKNANVLVETLAQFPDNSNIILVIRHSHRNSFKNLDDIGEQKLTPIGHEIAKLFGTKLPLNRKIELYYSPIKRCVETAEDILAGFESITGNGALIESLNVLYDIGVEAEYFFNEVTKYPFTYFLYRWIANLYPADKVTPFDEFCQKAAKVIWNKTANKNDSNNLYIHVSHDLMILSYRLGWFGLSPADRWPSFLDGFAFSINNEHLLLLDDGKLSKVEAPYWWNRR